MNKYEQEINRNTTINSHTGKNGRFFQIVAEDGSFLAFAEGIKNRKGIDVWTFSAVKPPTNDIETARLYIYAAAKLQRYIDSIILMEEDVKSKGL